MVWKGLYSNAVLFDARACCISGNRQKACKEPDYSRDGDHVPYIDILHPCVLQNETGVEKIEESFHLFSGK